MSEPQGLVRPEGLGKFKISPIGSRPRDLKFRNVRQLNSALDIDVRDGGELVRGVSSSPCSRGFGNGFCLLLQAFSDSNACMRP
jgi:hypothetical protein